MAISKVQLIPWDYLSDQHILRLQDQRRQCGWHAEKPPTTWRDEQRKGAKCIYWIVFSPEDSMSTEKLNSHLAMFPEEREALQDTATTIRAVPRSPTHNQFHPVGHISLDVENTEAIHLKLDLPTSGVYWIKTFYVSKALQGTGIGRAAMDMAEHMATSEPLNAKTLALDTAHGEDQLMEFAGRQTPDKSTMVGSQAWYTRRGYRLIHEEVGHYKDADGVPWVGRTVFMRRDLA